MIKSSRYRRLRKNPLVRLLRRIYKFFRSIFKLRSATFRSNRTRSFSNDLDAGDSTTTAATRINRMPTIGETLDRVNWQFTPSAPLEQPPPLNSNTGGVKTANRHRSTAVKIAPHQAATITSNSQIKRIETDEFMTIGELFEKVKWQHSLSATQVTSLNNRKSTRTFDTSRN